MYEANKKGTGSQAKNAKLIMSLVVPNGKNGWKVDVDSAQFTHVEKKFDEESHVRASNGMPKRVFLANVFRFSFQWFMSFSSFACFRHCGRIFHISSLLYNIIDFTYVSLSSSRPQRILVFAQSFEPDLFWFLLELDSPC